MSPPTHTPWESPANHTIKLRRGSMVLTPEVPFRQEQPCHQSKLMQPGSIDFPFLHPGVISHEKHLLITPRKRGGNNLFGWILQQLPFSAGAFDRRFIVAGAETGPFAPTLHNGDLIQKREPGSGDQC